MIALLVVGVATGAIDFQLRFFLIRDTPQAGRVPVDNVPQVGTPEDGFLSGKQVSFRYPRDWQLLREPHMVTAGSSTGSTILGFGTGDEVAVETMQLQASVDAANLDQFRAGVEASLRDALGSGWGIEKGPIDTTLGGVPAFEYHLRGPNPTGVLVNERIVFTAHGATEFWVACDSTRAHRKAMTTGCDQILRTFRIR